MWFQRIVIISLLVRFTTIPALAQNAIPVSLQKDFDTYRSLALQEKIYLHTDKNFYLAGEICWFKIYYVDAFFHHSLDVSKVVYVELLDRADKAVWQAKIPVEKGEGHGSVQLPANIRSDQYRMRAYTNWMKNFSPDYFFEKTITVVNSRKIPEREIIATSEKYFVHFFPEGGNLVNGIQSKIAFQVVNQFGKGIPCKGIIVTDKSDTISTLATFHSGTGTFLFKPEKGKACQATLKLPDGSTISQPLPDAFEFGEVMRLESVNPNQLKITVQSAAKHTGPVNIYLFVHTRGSIKSVQAGKTENGTVEFLVDKNKLGDGISHFTVFNEQREPVCERLCFKYPQQRLEIGLKTDSTVYDLRKKVRMLVNSADGNGTPTRAHLSMAVYRVDSLQAIDEMNISNYLWLSSDLTGKVESPQYYFSHTGRETDEAMDNLMLTRGWRRFRWEDILQQKRPAFEFIPEYDGHIVKGRTISTTNALPGAIVGGFLSVPGTRTQFYNAISDSLGYIQFETKKFYNEGEVIVQTNTGMDSGYRIEIAKPFLEKFSVSPLPAFSVSQVNTTVLANYHAAFQVQNTYNSNRAKQYTLPLLDTNAFYVKPDASYLLDNYVRFTTMEEVLREYVTQVNVRKRNGGFFLPALDAPNRRFFESDPLVLLDGVPVFDMNKIISYDPMKVRKLEVVSRMYFLGNMFFQGIINLITYEGNLTGHELDPRATVVDYEGLQLKRAFYAPVYETPQQADSRLPDFRSLLHWKPDIKTNEKGISEISFYSSDRTGKYVAVIQGITADGKTGVAMLPFEVKETPGN
jgi:hypothetical protein